VETPRGKFQCAKIVSAYVSYKNVIFKHTLSSERQSAGMSKIKNGGIGGFDQYGSGPFEQQQFGTADIEGVKAFSAHCNIVTLTYLLTYLTSSVSDLLICFQSR